MIGVVVCVEKEGESLHLIVPFSPITLHTSTVPRLRSIRAIAATHKAFSITDTRSSLQWRQRLLLLILPFLCAAHPQQQDTAEMSKKMGHSLGCVNSVCGQKQPGRRGITQTLHLPLLICLNRTKPSLPAIEHEPWGQSCTSSATRIKDWLTKVHCKSVLIKIMFGNLNASNIPIDSPRHLRTSTCKLSVDLFLQKS